LPDFDLVIVDTLVNTGAKIIGQKRKNLFFSNKRRIGISGPVQSFCSLTTNTHGGG
jgi:hypothetical protein